MKKILLPLLMIALVATAVGGATYAVFSDQAILGPNTFTTGVLEIRLDGQERLAGFNVTNAAPGDSVEKVFTLSNYGAPWFAGPSTLDAKGLLATTSKTSGDEGLYNILTAKLYANAGWGGCSNSVPFVAGKGCQVYSGLLKDMNKADILNATQWGVHPALAHGNSLTMTLDVELPIATGNEMQGKSSTFDLLVDAYSSWPL